MQRTFFLSLIPAVMLLAVNPPAAAQMFKDNTLQALYQQDRSGELQRLARERVAAQSGDSQAVLALALGSLETNDAPARQAAMARAEACLQQQPQAAACHYALGVVLGIQAMSEGMLKAARSIGTVKTALVQAQALEPAWFPARSALVEFYLAVPGMLGGSTAKARELARAAATPDQVRGLQARVDLHEGQTAAAMTALAGLTKASDPSLAEDARQWGMAAAAKLVNDGQAAQAQAFFDNLLRDEPASAAGAYGLARVRAASGEHAQALKLYEQAAGAKDAARWPVDYRRGITLQELGRKDEARAAYTRFISAGKGQKASLDDARKRLDAMGT